MFKRLIVGLFLGAVVGGVLAAVLVQGLGITSFDTWALGAAGAYIVAAVTGVVTGLVAGKPIWSADGKMEAGLKAFFGALLALGGMFVLRQWAHVIVDLTSVKASFGPSEIGQLPAVSLPIIASVLAAFFELDNTDAGEKAEATGGGTDGKSSAAKLRVKGDDVEDEEEEEEEKEAPAKKRR